MELLTEEPRVKAALTVALIAVLSVVIFRLGDQASADVTIDDVALWAEHGIAGEVVKINPGSGEILARVVVGEPGEAIAAYPVASGAIVMNRSTATVRMVDDRTLRAGTAVELDLADPATATILTDPGNDSVFVLSGGTVLELDPTTLDQVVRSTDRPVSSPIIDTAGRLLAVDPSGPFVRRLDPNGFGPFVPLVAGDGSSPAPELVTAGDSVFMIEPERLSVSEVFDDAAVGPASCFTRAAPGQLVAGTTTKSGSILRAIAYDPEDGVLAVAEPHRPGCFDIELDLLGENFGPPVVVDDLAYLPNWDLGQIEVVDLADRTELGRIPFSSVPGQPFELEVFGTTVIANEPQGPFAAIIEGTDVTTIQKLEAVVVGSSATDGDRFGATTPVVAGRQGSTGAQALGNGGAQVAGDSAESSSDGDLDLADAEVLGVAVENVEVIDALELAADFNFSSDTVAVGEPVRFTDRSTGNPVDWLWEFGDESASTEPDVEKSWSSPGEYRVQLTVADATGNRAVASTVITVVPASTSLPPVADFVFESSVVEAGTPLEFTSLSTGDPDSLLWTFGDGAGAEGVQVVHTYGEVGDYTVTLVAENEAGSTSASTVITVIEATEPPIAVINPLPRFVEVGQAITAVSASQNEPTSTEWDFGDGRRRSGSSVRHSWTSPGTYRVRLTVSNSAGTDSTVSEITVVPAVDPPDARFTETTRSTVVGEPITFTDLSLNEPTAIAWDFGDGATASGSVVTHAWAQPGTYDVQLRVSNEAGSDRLSKSIRVVKAVDPPIASFQQSSTRSPVGSTIQFTDTSINEPTRWRWDFGDGTIATGKFASHTYTEPGTYSVRLRATNKAGRSVAESTVTIFGPPRAEFDIQVLGRRVVFWDKSTGDPTAWDWSASNGESSSAQNPEIVFDEPGTYEMTLVASNAAGDSAPRTRTVTVYDDPEARFNYEERFLTVAFFDRSTDATELLWDFGDGTTSTETDPLHTYDEPGAYDVTLTASNPAGEDSLTRRIRIDVEPLEADFDCELGDERTTVVCDAVGTTGATSYSWSAVGARSIEGADRVVATFDFPPCGRFTIALEVSNELGDTDEKTRRTPSLGDGEIPEVRDVRVESSDGLEVTLRGSARHDPDTWDWRIGGGEIVDGAGTREVTFRFEEAGTYDGSVSASNVCGTSEVVTFSVDIEEPVDVDQVDRDD